MTTTPPHTGAGQDKTDDAAVTTTRLSVCTTCNGPDKGERALGDILFSALGPELASHSGVLVEPVKCLAVCRRPCTIALTSRGKWTYVIGDLDCDAHVADIAAATLRYHATEDGLIPWKERPMTFRKGIVCRVPPFSG
jgi:predicted metal-binding protein